MFSNNQKEDFPLDLSEESIRDYESKLNKCQFVFHTLPFQSIPSQLQKPLIFFILFFEEKMEELDSLNINELILLFFKETNKITKLKGLIKHIKFYFQTINDKNDLFNVFYTAFCFQCLFWIQLNKIKENFPLLFKKQSLIHLWKMFAVISQKLHKKNNYPIA